jgi:phytoene/squalene synthetase
MSEADDFPDVESWSGKDRGDENFPVGSALIARRYRDPIHRFYRFARNADDIADSPALSPQDKIARLDIMECAGVARQPGEDRAVDAACDRPADRIPAGCDEVALCDDRRAV